MREFINIVEGFFDRKPPARFSHQAPFREPVDSKLRDEIANARQYASAEDYAAAMNPISRMNSDPPQIQDRYEREQEALITKWQRWQQLGYLTTPAENQIDPWR